jgi:hypothetical protein
MTDGANYALTEWAEALEAGREWEWCPIDTQENTPGAAGDLGCWLAENVIGWDMRADGTNEHCDHVTDDMVEAVLNVLREDGHLTASGEDVKRVLSSYRGETGDDFRVLAEEYAEENGYKLVGLKTDGEFEQWYAENGIPDGEVCGELSVGGTLHWFNLNQR